MIRRMVALTSRRVLTLHGEELPSLLFPNKIHFANISSAEHLDLLEAAWADLDLCTKLSLYVIPWTWGIHTSRTLIEWLEYVLRKAIFPGPSFCADADITRSFVFFIPPLALFALNCLGGPLDEADEAVSKDVFISSL